MTILQIHVSHILPWDMGSMPAFADQIEFQHGYITLHGSAQEVS